MLNCNRVNLPISLLLVAHLSLLGQFGQQPAAHRHHQRNAPIKLSHDKNDKPGAQSIADSVAHTVAQLRAIKTDPLAFDVPVAARPLLITLKQQLRELINETLNTAQPQDQLGAIQAQARVLIALKHSNVRVAEPPAEVDAEAALSRPYIYGAIDSIKLTQPAGLHNVIVATTTVSVCCGSDTSLYLFQKRGARWMLALAQEANGYAQIDGAQGMFDYGIAPSDRAGHFFVVTTNVNPWCTSNWQRLRYSVLRVGARPETPQVLKRGAETIYLGVDEPYHLSVTQRGFNLIFEGESTPDEITRRHHLIYRINDTGAHLLRKD